MIGLIEGIKVIDYGSNTSSFKPRLWLNSGTEFAKDLVPTDNYDRDAFIPSESWREANIIEQKIIYNTNYKVNTGSCIDKSNHIGILPLPDLLTEAFEELGVPFASTMSDCSFLWQQPACQEAVKNMIDYVKTFSELMIIKVRRFMVLAVILLV
ncbi:MAG: hypothetical protein HC908_14115 [Calothrix sp. SM1_7_51]|nr:hypothetical protein [Calothrix sp. SM1_7_51]